MIPDVWGIYGFSGDFAWLSNFHLCDEGVLYEGMLYPSSEAAYQAAKTLNLAERQMFIKMGGTMKQQGNKARHMGYKSITLRPDWEQVKYQVMFDILFDKFSRDESLTRALLQTDGMYLEETNKWGDRYWGVCDGTGENNLGKILMEIREKLKESKS